MKRILLIAILNAAICNSSLALEVETHKAINEDIARKSKNGFSLDVYLKNQMGLQGGADEIFKSQNNIAQKAWQWLRDGGAYEDDPTSSLSDYLLHRYTNHFHNPLATSLSSAGFSGIWGTGFLSGESAILWSQEPIGVQNNGGSYSWHDVRDYYYKALTSPNKDTRSSYFAETFRGIGQLMHLVHDMSVPEHTRNDGHYVRAYEAYVKDMHSGNNLKDQAIFNAALANPIFFDMTKLSQSSQFTEARVPIANLFDTNQYKGDNPTIIADNNTIGLSEYTNANFVSPDTIFQNFPYPSKETSVVKEDRDFPDYVNPGNNIKRQYYIKKADGETNGGNGYRLSGVDYLNFYRESTIDPTQLQLVKTIAPMDDYVYQDYAPLLLPRAVGYSAGLLNYFFRGEMDMAPDLDNPGSYIIKNFTNETLIGKFELYYDDKTGKRKKVPLSQETLEVGGMNGDQPGKSIPVTFIAPTDPEPEEKGKYILVFQGTLGSEQGSVVGKVVNLENIWEDWEYGLTGRHGWPQIYTVIVGFEANRTKVLKITGSGVAMNPETPFTLPKKVSFNYYVKSFGMDPRNNFGLSLGYNSAPYFITNCSIGLYNPGSAGYCGTSICKTIERGSWIHVEADISNVCSSSWTQSQVERVKIDVWGGYALEAPYAPAEIYLDNIDFE